MGIPVADYLRMQAQLSARPPRIIQGTSDEGELHEQIVAECRAKRWPIIHSRMDRRSTIGIGCPDFVVLADKKRVFFIECKSRTGKLTIEQLAFSIMAEQCGHKVHVIRSFSEFLTLIQQCTSNSESPPLKPK